MVTISVKVPNKIHTNFKSLCVQQEITMNEKVAKLLDDFLAKKEKKPKISLKDFPEEEKSITIRISDSLHQELKFYCFRNKKTLKNIVKKRIINYTVNNK